MNNYDIWLANSKVSNAVKINLIRKYKTSQNVWYHTIDKEDKVNIKYEVIEALRVSWNMAVIGTIEEKIEKNGIRYVTYTDDNFPERLRLIEDPPFILFYYGDIDKLGKGYSISLVGSRKCTPYGINVTKFITKDICANNINVISGMAKGIDGYAHKTALESGGFTCAVLGCGIDIIYPRENRNLYFDMQKNGCILSEFIPGTQPFSYNFPMRNRIISALSDIVIIVEAGTRSGSLITANCALDQGKDVMVVPGSVFSEQSQGTNRLIRDGANPFTSIDDIYSTLGIKRKNNSKEVKILRSTYEDKILNILSDSPLHIDDIIRMADIDIKHLYEVLFEMQLRDEVICLTGNYYVKTNG